MNIAVINTGGTISCIGNPLGPMTAQAFAQACTQYLNPILLQAYPDLVMHYVVDLPFPESQSHTLDSTNLQPTDWCLIANYILQHYDAYDGWVILHGTDSMDFTGTALPFLLNGLSAQGVQTAVLSKPVIITGSQVPMFYQAQGQSALTLNYNTDAFQNFCGSVASAQTGIAEVAVYFQNHLYRGSRVLKTNASEFNAFSSPNYPALAEFGVTLTLQNSQILPPPVSLAVSLDNPSVRQQQLALLDAITAHINSVPVMQLNAFPAWYNQQNSSGLLAQLIKACVAQGIRGLVLESYGEGNFPSGNPDQPSAGACYQALQQANTQGVVIVDCTQVISGVVNNSAYAAGAWLPSVGALSPADMTPMAALAKLMILLAQAPYQGWSLDEVKTLLQTNLLGEMLAVNQLDSRTQNTLRCGQSLNALDGSASLLNHPNLGPVLTDSHQEILWAALSSPPPASAMPGRLVMQDDGNLVFYSRNNQALWASNTGHSNGASSRLSLTGSMSHQDLQLQIFNYSAPSVSAVLYAQG